MARLKGDLVDIDLMTPFSVRPGGRVFDLSRDLHFEIQWNSSLSKVIERFTGDQLPGMGHSADPGPGNHTGMLIQTAGSRFLNLSPNLSWSNDEFTIAFWVKFRDDGSIFYPNSFGEFRQFDFISSRIPSSNQKFSSYVKKVSSTKIRAYFGYRNYQSGLDDYLWNFCDTYDNSNLIISSAKNHKDGFSGYHSEDASPFDIELGQWVHIVIRNKVAKNGSNGICDLWINGEIKSRNLSQFSNTQYEKQFDLAPPGSSPINENDLLPGGSITQFIKPINPLTPRVLQSPYPEYLPSPNDKLFLSAHSFFQIAKWNRILDESEIRSIYQGTVSGVYTSRKTSVSTPPRKKITEAIIGHSGYNDVKSISGKRDAYCGKNLQVGRFNGEESLELTSSFGENVLQTFFVNDSQITNIGAFSDEKTSSITNCIDGSIATEIVRIDLSSVERNDNLQYAGRTDSRLAKTVSSPLDNFSMFLSSALYRHGNLSSDYRPDGSYVTLDTGIAGTGFLYYSPKRKCWIEKRSQHETSYGYNTQAKDYSNSTNAIEINPHTTDDGNGGWLPFNLSITPPYDTNIASLSFITGTAVSLFDLRYTYSSKPQITGSSEILRQFTASPQLGYFSSKKESLKRAGYENIGSPTVTFGAPFSPKYHAFDDETIKLSNFIDGPFLLKKAILKIPVEIQRIDEPNSSFYEPVAYFNFEQEAFPTSTVEDITGNGHVATLFDFATSSMSDTPNAISGRGCLDLTYNASSTAVVDRLVINHSSDLSIGEYGFSISLWMKITSLGTFNHSIIYKTSNTGGDDKAEYYFYLNASSGDLSFRINDTASTSYNNNYIGRKITNAAGNYTLSNWHHVVVSYDGSATSDGIRIYFDGSRQDDGDDNNGSFTAPLVSTYNVYIGSREKKDSATDMRGKVASLIFWNRALKDRDAFFLKGQSERYKRYNWNWSKNVTMRKDIDNYVFFLYRQRRANSSNVIDSLQDISSSARFLIGSGSVCVYNSSSFGLSKNDGFSDMFGYNTPITSNYSPGTSRQTTLNRMFEEHVSGTDPITSGSLEEWSSPLHTPSVSIETGLKDFLSGGIYREKMYLEIEIDPSYVMGGYPNNTLMYLTTSKGHLSTSFHGKINSLSYNSLYSNRLFNWYPQKGVNLSDNKEATPPITTVFQNFWFGGTRQPIVVAGSSGGYNPPGSLQTVSISPYYQFDNSKEKLANVNSLMQWPKLYRFGASYVDIGSTSPEFDIEIARSGISFYNFNSKPFETDLQIVNDSRGAASSFSEYADPGISAVFQRSELVTASAYDDETTLYLTGTFTINEGLKDCMFIDLVSSLTVGYAPSSLNKSRNVYNPYLLLPEDELVIGLDAGITPPPDIAPYLGENLTDYNPSGGHKPPQEAFINPILKEQIWHYAGNSYMRILPGAAEILLVGDYLGDNKTIQRTRGIVSKDISVAIGNDPLFDQYQNLEADACASTYFVQNFTGSMINGTRGVSSDDSVRALSGGSTLKPCVTLTNDSIVLSDPYFSGVLI